jgi:hypothetical protein
LRGRFCDGLRLHIADRLFERPFSDERAGAAKDQVVA